MHISTYIDMDTDIDPYIDTDMDLHLTYAT